MSFGRILAVVVSYNGGVKILNNIRALLQQVDMVFIVDNGSKSEYREMLRSAFEENPRVEFCWLPTNQGIGFALNVGVSEARKREFSWLLTMDQDSTISDNMIDKYKSAIKSDSSVVCVAPQFIHPTLRPQPASGIKEVPYAITSGNLVKLSVYDRIGLYDESLFIDGVDFDFSLRVRQGGYAIHLIEEAHMYHELGDRHSKAPLIGRYHTFHSPLRRYYIFRNFLYLASRYYKYAPRFVLKMTLSHVLYLLTILILGDHRLDSFKFIARGVADWMRGVTGTFKA